MKSPDQVSSSMFSGSQTSRPLMQAYMRSGARGPADSLRKSKPKSPLSLSQLGGLAEKE